MDVPADLRRDKGWTGKLFDRALGVSGTNRPQPDFPELGVELKTIPIDRRGQPRESTFVCSAPLSALHTLTWEQSRVRSKVACILWIPVEAEASIPLGERRAGSPLLWRPSDEEEAALKRDWEDIAAMIAEGFTDAISATRGEILQLRPKGANAESERRGFYLRRRFTATILEQNYVQTNRPE